MTVLWWRRAWVRRLPVVVAMGGLFYLSHQPGDSFTLPDVVSIDKVLHCLVYMILGITFFVALSPEWRYRQPFLAGCATVLFCLCYGIFDEWHQSFIAGRYAGGADVMADVGGGVLAVACDYGWRRWRGATMGEVVR